MVSKVSVHGQFIPLRLTQARRSKWQKGRDFKYMGGHTLFDANIIPFCERDSSILRFWCPRGSWHQALGTSKGSHRELTETGCFFFFDRTDCIEYPNYHFDFSSFLEMH